MRRGRGRAANSEIGEVLEAAVQVEQRYRAHQHGGDDVAGVTGDRIVALAPVFAWRYLKLSCPFQVEKNSEKLGREAVYKLSNRVKKLPYYLTIQMMRFEWNAISGNKAKILRECQFNLSFDAYDLCTPELQEKLRIVPAPTNQKHFASAALATARGAVGLY